MLEAAAVASITVLAVISPGADFAMVTRNSMVLSRRAGLLTAAGISLGVLVHVAYSMAGIGLLISQSILLFNAIKLAGAAYLVYLGVTMLRARKADHQQSDNTAVPVSDWAALRAGFLTNALNPKTTLFVVSLFTQVISPNTPLLTQFGYGAFMSFAHLVWFALVACAFSSAGFFPASNANPGRLRQVWPASGSGLIVGGDVYCTRRPRQIRRFCSAPAMGWVVSRGEPGVFAFSYGDCRLVESVAVQHPPLTV